MKLAVTPVHRWAAGLPWRRIRPRIWISNVDSTLRNVSLSQRYLSAPPSRPTLNKETVANDTDAEAFPLPLPRALSPSKGLFLLSLPIAPEHWPSHLDLYSALYRKSTKLLKSDHLAVNCIYDGQSQLTSFDVHAEEKYPARLFRADQKVIDYPSFSIDMIDQVKRDLSSTDSPLDPSSGGDGKVEVLVCTHGSRDCRCSDRGGALVSSLREEIIKRGLDGRIRVSEIAHVGGHKYAANAIVLPSLDMYSNLLVTDASAMVDHLLSTTTTTTAPSKIRAEERNAETPAPGVTGYLVPSPFWAHWRGRYGSTEDEQARIWSMIDPEASKSSIRQDTIGSMSSADEKKEVSLVFRTWEGEKRTVSAFTGDSLLDVARREDLPSMEGTCEGNLECSTCHLYIDPSAPIPEPKDEELDMLDYALGYREGQSRLGCQIKVDKALVGWCEAGGELKLPRY